MFIEKYPYTNFNEYNLDWIIAKIREIDTKVDNMLLVDRLVYRGDWDITQQYPAWSIVRDPNTWNGYVALQDVPNGILISNLDYWLPIYEYSGELTVLEGRVDDLETDTASLDNRLDTVEGALPSIQSSITDLNTETDNLRKRNIRIIGDSYATTNGSGLQVVTPYTDLLPGILGLDSDHYAYASQNGSGFGNERFNNLLETLTSSDEVTEVYVFGGINDRPSRVDTATVNTNMEAFATRAKQKFPNAKLYLGFLGWGYNPDEAHVSEYVEVSARIYGRCTNHGFNAYVPSHGICVQEQVQFWVDTTTSQGMAHPSTVGEGYIAMRLAQLIAGHGVDYAFETTNVPAAASGVTFSTDSAPHLAQTNNGHTINKTWNDLIWFTTETDVSIPLASSSGYFVIGTFANCLGGGRLNYNRWVIPGRYRTRDVAGWQTALYTLDMVDHELRLKSASGTLSNVYEVILFSQGCSITPFVLNA